MPGRRACPTWPRGDGPRVLTASTPRRFDSIAGSSCMDYRVPSRWLPTDAVIQRLLLLQIRLCRHAAEHHLLPFIVADLSEKNLERAPLILTSGSHVAAVNVERDQSRSTLTAAT